MKYAILILAALLLTVPLSAAGDEQEQIVLEETLDVSFGRAWAGVKNAMEVRGCSKPEVEKVIEPAEEGGQYKGLYKSDYCIIVTGEDSTKTVMERYGEMPRIRMAIWTTGRIKYYINVKELENRKAKITLKAQMSGYEEYITSQVYFWNSNGILEREMMALIIKMASEAKTSE